MPRAVVLDPGHGVDTAGKRSPDGSLREYEFNGYVAQLAKDMLEDHGIRVVLTRPTTKDAKDVPLSQRVKIANASGADIFVSIHANAFGTTWNAARGYEVYIYKPGGESEKLAKLLVEEAERVIVPAGVPLRKPTIKTESFYVLRYTAMPATLIEHAFMTNREECELLKSADFRRRCAEHIARAVCRYFGVAWKGVDAKVVGTSKPVLRRGSTGAAVRELQEKLNRLGFDCGPVDGIFGPRTEAAVRWFQQRAGIAVDGVVGPVTWSALEAALARKETKTAPEASDGPFKDVPARHPAAEAIAWLKARNIAQGYPDGTFRPDQPVTRAELALMLHRALGSR